MIRRYQWRTLSHVPHKRTSDDGQDQWSFKLLKDDNPQMLLVHCDK